MPEMSSEHHTEIIRAQLLSKAVLRPDETELYELTQLAGVTMDPQVFKIILDLLKLNVPPVAIIQTLKSMCSPHHHGNINKGPSAAQQPSPHVLARGEPHPGTSLGRGDISHGASHEFSQPYSTSHATRGDLHSRTAGSASQERSTSRDRYLAKAAASSSRQDGSHYSSYSSTDGRDNSRTYSRITSDTPQGSYGSRSHERRSQSPASRPDSFVTTRQRKSTSDYNNYRDRDQSSKKRSSYHD